MSYTAVYSQLERIEDGRAPRILDIEAWGEWCEHQPISEDTLRDCAVLDEQKEHANYPKEEYKVIKGFKTWSPGDLLHDDEVSRRKFNERYEDYSTAPIGFQYNIERFGIGYGDFDKFESFWASLGEFTDSFRFYHGAYEHQLLRAQNINTGCDEVYYVECRDGEIGVWKLSYGIQDAEEIA